MSFVSLRNRLRRLSSQRWKRRPPNPEHRLGRRGERAATRYLRRRGLRGIARNYRTDAGEIDLICTDRETIVFVEVKARVSDETQDPSEAVSPRQWRRVENAARHFLLTRTTADRPYRFDLVTVLWPEDGEPTIEHFENAHRPRMH